MNWSYLFNSMDAAGLLDPIVILLWAGVAGAVVRAAVNIGTLVAIVKQIK